MKTPSWQDLVDSLELQPHPEGGFYRETYRAATTIHVDSSRASGHAGPRSFSTAIYYLLPAGATSSLHRLKSDEIFHFYLGGGMTLLKLGPKGEVEAARLGQDLAAGQRLQHVVPAGWWFGGWCDEGSPFALVGCTVAPGFDFADFELGDRAELIRRYPRAESLIRRCMPEERR